LEHWIVDDSICKEIIEAHPDSQQGISQMVEILSQSPLIRGKIPKEMKILATTAFDSNSICLWKLNTQKAELEPFFKIDTSLAGISHLLETQDT
jgi:hypothetical protein